MVPIQEVEDAKRCDDEGEIGAKSVKELLEKGKQALIVIPRADPFHIFHLSNSDEDLETKARKILDTYKDIGHPSDIRPSDTSEEESEVAITILKISLEDNNVCGELQWSLRISL